MGALHRPLLLDDYPQRSSLMKPGFLYRAWNRGCVLYFAIKCLLKSQTSHVVLNQARKCQKCSHIQGQQDARQMCVEFTCAFLQFPA